MVKRFQLDPVVSFAARGWLGGTTMGGKTKEILKLLSLTAIIIAVFISLTAGCAEFDSSKATSEDESQTSDEVIFETKFSVESLDIPKTTLQPEEAITVLVLVANTGNASGSYKVDLKVDGEVYIWFLHTDSVRSQLLGIVG